jgi:hypothetical protein
VDPNGAATRYWVQYGTSEAYGLITAEQDAGAGADPVNVKAALSGLTADTTYHYRVVARNAAGEARGADRTLRTAAPAQRPTIASRVAIGIHAIGATLRAYVNPRGHATTVRFEYGPTSRYGTATAEQAIGAGNAGVTVSVPVAGLTPNKRYHFRAVATNAAGVTNGARRTFTTPRAPTGVAITPSTVRPVWGQGLTISGSVTGASSTPVALEKQEFPFDGPFYQVASTRASSSGAFTLAVPPLYTTSRLRVITRSSVVVASPVMTASVAVKVGVRARRVTGRRLLLAGSIWPAVPNGRVSVQRQTRSGRWIRVERTTPTAMDGNRSRYTALIRRSSRRLNYRVVVVARDGGRHVPGYSKIVTR